MTLGEEASRSLSGAWGLLRRDPAAPQAFNATLDGVWRSFFAAVLLLPLYLASLAIIAPAAAEGQAAGATRWIVNFLIYVISWAAWPLVAFYMTRLMDCGDRLLGYVAAYNWSQLLTWPFLIGIFMLDRLGLPPGFFAFLVFAGRAAVLFYEYLIARQMLGAAANKAIVLVLASYLLSLILHDTADYALRLAAPDMP